MGKLADLFLRYFRGKELLPLKNALWCDEKINQEINFNRKREDLERFDVVDLTKAEITETELEMSDVQDALRKPPLYDFIFKINDGEGNAVEFLLHCHGKHSKAAMAKDGHTYLPLLNISQLNQRREVVAIMQVLAPKNSWLTIKKRLVATDYYDDTVSYNQAFAKMEVMIDYVLWHYVYMAIKFRNCPRRFVKTDHGNRREFTMGAEVTPLREVKVECKVAAESEERTKGQSSEHTEEPDDNHRKITCPYWTVRGHDRHLKNGKVIRIEPYAKGKERNNPEKNVPKKYTI